MSGLIFTVNRTNAPTRRETIGEIDYLIVPVVALVAGVVNGELVTPEQIEPVKWNGVPVPLGHPQVNGVYVSGRTPELEAVSPGRFFNARLENGALKGDIYINLAQASDGEAAEAVKRFEAGQMVNVSTAYFRDLAEAGGEWGGKVYNGIATNLQPDHLAILLNEDGACSLKDGCGAPRVNQQEGRVIVNVELSLDEKMNQVYRAWNEKYAGPNGEMMAHIREIFNEFVIARTDKGGLWAYPYTVNEGDSIEFGQPYQVEIAYHDKESGVQINKWLSRIAEKLGIKSQETEDTTVKRDELIAALVANTRVKISQETLGKMADCELQALSEQLAEVPAQPDPAPTPAPSTSSGQAPAAPAETPAQPDPMAARLDKIEQMLTGLTGQVQANASQEKADLVARLTANQTTFSEAELNGFELPMLRKLAGALTPADYSGRGMPVVNTGGDWEEYQAPVISQNGGAK